MKPLIPCLLAAVLLSACGSKPVVMSGNPLFDGWYADPEGIIYDDTYWIYPTWSDHYDRPEGPYRDLLGKPLINDIVNGTQPIDQFVFRDGDEYYLYYGGWGHCNIARLNSDFTALIPFDDGDIYKEITPANYVEGPFMLKRNNKYYFMWSEGGWTGPDYSVAYAIADSPFGPFNRIGTILQQDSLVATGAGHHSVVQIPNTEDYYIIYHRRPLEETHGNHRATCIEKMIFDEKGFIQPVKLTFEGVEARVIDNH